MLNYIFLSTLTWTLMMVFYVLLLRKEKYFTYNRIFLLSSIALGLVLPILPRFSFLQNSSISNFTANLPVITITNQDLKTTLTLSNGYEFGNILILIYVMGLLYFVFKLIKSLLHIKRYYSKSKITQVDKLKIVRVKDSIVAFSFFNYVFINEDLYNSKQRHEILMHESVHVKQGHSYDIIISEILKSIFWFNPVVYIFNPLLSETHEFIADNHVIQKISKKSYGELLINQLQSGVQYNIANYFINSLIKNRIKMMYKQKSNRQWKYLLAFPLIFTIILGINTSTTAQITQKKDNTKTTQPTSKDSDEVIYQVVEQMPRFPGCEDIQDKEKRANCSIQKLYEYIYNNLKYPESAVKNKIEGRVMIRFVVNKTGKISKVKVLRDIGGGCGEEAARVIMSTNNLPDRWIPGRQNGKPVSVYYTFPVLYKLTNPKPKK